MEATRLVLVALIVSMMEAKGVVGRAYTVGDEDEWSSQANFERWANSHNFSVGDVLVFKYVKGEHNVYEVREEAYRSCEAREGEIMGKYESGEDEVELRKARKYWFICNIAGHCLGGMRFGILVLNPTTPPLAAASAAFSTPPPPPPPPSPNSSPSTCYLLPYSLPFTLTIVHLLIFSPFFS